MNRFLTTIFLLIFLSNTVIGCQPPLPPSSSQDIDQAINWAGEWFLNNQNDNFLYYEYYPDTDTYADNDHPLRELASLWSITRLHQYTDDPRYQELTNRGLDYFEHYIYEDKENDYLYLKYGEARVTIGDSAFMILVLSNSDHPDRKQIMTQLADGILLQQTDAGYLPAYFHYDTDFNQNFIPGEALLALMTTYEETQDSKYLEATRKSFEYYRQYWRDQPSTELVPWHSRAYYKLYQATHDQAVADFIFEMNDYVLNHFNPQDKCQNFDLDGGGTVAVNLEGVVQAFIIAQQLNDQDRIICYQNFINESVPYIISFQVPTHSDLPLSAIGGVWNINYDSQRVDRNQHFVMALIDYQYSPTTKPN